MNGIEILDSQQIYEWSLLSNIVGFICLFSMSALIIFFVIHLIKKEWLCSFCLAAIVFIIFSFTNWFVGKTAIKYTEYKVTISDSVNFNDFNE